MKDYLGQELAPGDKVLYIDGGKYSKDFYKGLVTGLTAKQVLIRECNADHEPKPQTPFDHIWKIYKPPTKVLKILG